jgi:Ala-tRNA(Pro) deacylase
MTMPQEAQDLPTNPQTLLGYLDDLGIKYNYTEHEAVFRVADSTELDRSMPGVHCRNLFLKDKKNRMFLVCVTNDTTIDLKKLPALIESDRLSFGSAERLYTYLGVRPGSVCPYAIVNDTEIQVKIILDKAMFSHEFANYHPLVNTMTIGVHPQDIVKFVEWTGHTAHIVDLSDAAPDTKA